MVVNSWWTSSTWKTWFLRNELLSFVSQDVNWSWSPEAHTQTPKCVKRCSAVRKRKKCCQTEAQQSWDFSWNTMKQSIFLSVVWLLRDSNKLCGVEFVQNEKPLSVVAWLLDNWRVCQTCRRTRLCAVWHSGHINHQTIPDQWVHEVSILVLATLQLAAIVLALIKKQTLSASDAPWHQWVPCAKAWGKTQLGRFVIRWERDVLDVWSKAQRFFAFWIPTKIFFLVGVFFLKL